jgi:predicted RNA binding protein YcfA (HicA-like mRNA interferase family)
MERTLDQKKAIRLLREDGWAKSRGGKHQVKMIKPGCRPITLPQHKGRDYPIGLGPGDTQTGGAKMRRLAPMELTARIHIKDGSY